MSILKKFEYGCIGASVLGSIWAIAQQQLAFFVIPATSALVLNLTNRQKEINKTNLQIAKLEKSLSHYDQSHCQEISAVKTSLLSVTSSEIRLQDNLIEQMDSDLAFLKENIFNTIAEHKSNFTEIAVNSNNLHALVSNIQLQLENTLKAADDLPEIYRQIEALNSGVSAKVHEAVDKAVSDKKINQAIQQTISRELTAIQQIYSGELVENRSGGRKVFLEALFHVEDRLILVCPWITKYAIDEEVKNLIVSALRRGVAIHVGWGYRDDVKYPDIFSKDNLLKDPKNPNGTNWKYSAVDWFYDRQKQFPNLVDIKLLGTHSKYLVCDRKFALVGSHNFMSSSDRTSWGISLEEEAGYKVTNPYSINKFINFFDKSRSADKKNVQKSGRS